MNEFRLNLLWLILLLGAGVFSVIFLYFTLFPGSVNPEALKYFSNEHLLRTKKYVKSVQLVFILQFILKVSFLTWFLIKGHGTHLSKVVLSFVNNYYLGVLIYFLIFNIIIDLISFPFSFYSSFILQHQWGFSTQSLLSWFLDYLKSGVLSTLISLIGVLIFFYVINSFPKVWWAITALLLSLFIIVQSFIWPILVSPLFNKFTPVKNPEIVEMVDNLSKKANISVGEVLEMDASKRTTKVNAYFAGLGSSKRIVLYDNLLNKHSLKEIEAVIAHEMAHWKKGHILKGILLGIIGTFLFFKVLQLALGSSFVNSFYISKVSPTIVVVILYFSMLVSFVTMPFENAISRAMEREADRIAVTLTGDKEAAINLQKKLSENNLSDVAPPAFIEWFSYSHPSTLKRIQLIEKID